MEEDIKDIRHSKIISEISKYEKDLKDRNHMFCRTQVHRRSYGSRFILQIYDRSSSLEVNNFKIQSVVRISSEKDFALFRCFMRTCVRDFQRNFSGESDSSSDNSSASQLSAVFHLCQQPTLATDFESQDGQEEEDRLH